MNATAIKLVVKFWHDDIADDPCDWGGWKVHSFGRRHYNKVEPEDIGFDYDDETGRYVPDEDLQAKLDSGLAFFLSYYEHSQCLWSLQGELPPGAQCPWDSVNMAGILTWEAKDDDIGAKTVEDRRKDAARFVELYTEWCNGHVFGYTVTAFKVCECCEQDVELSDVEADMDLPSCGGYYDIHLKNALIDLKDQTEWDRAAEIVFEDGHGAFVADEAQRLWKEMTSE